MLHKFIDGKKLEIGIPADLWPIVNSKTHKNPQNLDLSLDKSKFYFILSSDYRNAYLKEFNLIKTFFKKIFNNSPTTISVIPKVININKITPISS